jgi:hypothetical protein
MCQKYFVLESIEDTLVHGTRPETDLAWLAGGHTDSLTPLSNLYLINTKKKCVARRDSYPIRETILPRCWIAGSPMRCATLTVDIHRYCTCVQVVKDLFLQGRVVVSNWNSA